MGQKKIRMFHLINSAKQFVNYCELKLCGVHCSATHTHTHTELWSIQKKILQHILIARQFDKLNTCKLKAIVIY